MPEKIVAVISESERVKRTKEVVGGLLIGGMIGAIIGFLLSLFALVQLGPISGLLATLVLVLAGAGICAVIGALIGLIKYYAPWAVTALTVIIVLVFVVGFVWAFLVMQRAGTLPEYLKFATPLFETVQKGIKYIAEFRYCLVADPKCPFIRSWEEPNVQSTQERLQVQVSFEQKEIKESSFDLLVELSVSNPELRELKIRPKCFFKQNKEREFRVERLKGYEEGNEFKFGTTREGQLLHATFHCVGDIPEAAEKNIYSEIVVVELEREVEVETVWKVRVGEEPPFGLVRSEMSWNAPYLVSLASPNDMPFKQGQEYEFAIIIMKRKDEEVKLKRIEYLLVSYPEEIIASCPDLSSTDKELELVDVSFDSLKKIAQYDQELEKFVFPCSLYVARARKEAQLAPIQAKSRYVVYSDYPTRLVKKPK